MRVSPIVTIPSQIMPVKVRATTKYMQQSLVMGHQSRSTSWNVRGGLKGSAIAEELQSSNLFGGQSADSRDEEHVIVGISEYVPDSDVALRDEGANYVGEELRRGRRRRHEGRCGYVVRYLQICKYAPGSTTRSVAYPNGR